jgi:hypothetical protein
MALSIEQIQKLIQDQPRKKELALGTWHQNRLKFHTETKLLKADLSPYYQEFLAWITSEEPELLPKDKTDRFKQLLTCPVATIQLTQAIAICLSRVFEGQDAFNRYDFEDDKKEADWDKFHDVEFWSKAGAAAMVNGIDSVWVVDIASEQTTDFPEPKNQLIDISNVIDIAVNQKGECLYVIFTVNNKLFIYDEISIRTFDYRDKQMGSLLSELPHDLTYCPARMFWSELLYSGNWINRKAPLTNVLSELDWLLVHRVFKRYMDIGNSFPILVKYETDNTFEDVTAEKQSPMGKKLVGPGSIIEVPRPLEGQPDLMNNPVKWISPDIASLEFHVTEDVRLSDYIYKTTVGIDGEQKNDMAKNEKQVLASFENQSIILSRLAENFEKIQEFADTVIIKLRYGVESITDVNINYGSKFFLRTTSDLAAEKESMSGDDIMLDTIGEEMIETKFRNDTSGKVRAEVIRDLDPLPNITGTNKSGDSPIDETIKIYTGGGIDEETFIIKCNLMNFVRRFEREQLPISQFIKKGDYNERINLIMNEFKKYAETFKSKAIATAMTKNVTTDTSVTGDNTDMMTNPAKEKAGKVINQKVNK